MEILPMLLHRFLQIVPVGQMGSGVVGEIKVPLLWRVTPTLFSTLESAVRHHERHPSLSSMPNHHMVGIKVTKPIGGACPVCHFGSSDRESWGTRGVRRKGPARIRRQSKMMTRAQIPCSQGLAKGVRTINRSRRSRGVAALATPRRGGRLPRPMGYVE